MAANPLGLQPGIYSSDYYSGVQAGLYIGEVFIDELVSWRYELRQSKTPIYGYASQLFDTVAPGVKIVEGGFSVNFKEAGYLWLVLQRYKALEWGINRTIASAVGQGGSSGGLFTQEQLRLSEARGKNLPFWRLSQGGRFDHETRNTIERIIHGEDTRDERRRFITSIAQAAGGSSTIQFDRIVNEFESAVWTRENEGGLDLSSRSVDDNIFDDVDIYLTFGDITNPDPAVKSTVRRIRGVHFTGQGQEIVATGEPVLEYYTFIARTLV